MSVLWSKLYKHRPGRLIDGKPFTSDIEITEQARFLGHRYITRKMRRCTLAMGTASLKQVKNFDHRTDEHTTLIICQLIEALEQLYPETYSNISTNMLISNFNERPLCQDFTSFSEELFRNGIKWSLILGFYAFCGALAEECARHGCSRTMLSILNWIHCFTALRLSHWIKEQGGWAGLVDHFKTRTLGKEPEKSTQNVVQMYFNTLTQMTDLSSLKFLMENKINVRISRFVMGFIAFSLLLYFSFTYSSTLRRKEL